MHSRFQLLDGFEGLLSRPILKDEFQNKQFLLITSFMNELKELQTQFDENKINPPIHNNLPKRSGSISWCRGFKERIIPNMNKLKQIISNQKSNDIVDDEESKNSEDRQENEGLNRTKDRIKEIENMFSSFTKDIDDFEREQIELWRDEINETSEENLKKNILKKNGVKKKKKKKKKKK